MNRWTLTDEVKEKFQPILKEYFNKVENLTYEQIDNMTNEELGIDFSDQGINPYQLRTLLEEFGYEREDQEDNGWELDFWIYMRREDNKQFNSGCEKLVIAGCGMTFELKLYIEYYDY